MRGLADPDDPWFRLVDAIKRRKSDHASQVMAGDLNPALYAAGTARYDEDEQILTLIQQIRRNEDVSPRGEQRQSVGDQYGA